MKNTHFIKKFIKSKYYCHLFIGRNVLQKRDEINFMFPPAIVIISYFYLPIATLKTIVMLKFVWFKNLKNTH
jgi:hypothetical protein